MKNQHTKFIFVTGGVVSSLGKGIVAASVGSLLESRGLKISLTKVDPYLNIDPGTMNPLQHGEVFVTDDGAETDLDIGHYQRFTSAELTRFNSFSTGQVYDTVLSKERKGDYLGGTVQVIPHVTDQIKEFIYRSSQNVDIAIVEIGGTVGDIEGLPFLEAVRQMQFDLGRESVVCIHLTLVPLIKAAGELKTKPTQHSVKELRLVGLQPDILCLRADQKVPQELREKIARTCNVKEDCVLDVSDSKSIYDVPLYLNDQGLDQQIVNQLGIWTREPDLTQWQQIKSRIHSPKNLCTVGVVGKYTGVVDAYKSIQESLIHAGISTDCRVNVQYLGSEDMSNELLEDKKLDAILVPGGFGDRGIEGKIRAIQYAREKEIPFLGICLGMQLAAVEFARNKLKIEGAASLEFEPSSKNHIIHLMASQKDVQRLGATMRLGAYPCQLLSGTKTHKVYGEDSISERHRHRFEFNNDFRKEFEEGGMTFSGVSPDEKIVEMIELSTHPYFIGCQFHPELKSSPMRPHPLFKGLVEAALKKRGES